MEIDLKALTDTELNDLSNNIAIEQNRRRTLEEAAGRVQQIEQKMEEEVAAVAASYLAARDGTDDPVWTAPTGAHDAYPKDWTVQKDGKTWVSMVSHNAHAPGQSGWRQVSTDGSPVPWVQPAGAHDAYNEQDVVTHNGKTWESKIAGNVWEPPDQWTDVTPTAPAPETPTVAEWKQPAGGHDAYKKGQRVTFNGKTYESLIDGNVWSPTGYPAGWKVV